MGKISNAPDEGTGTTFAQTGKPSTVLIMAGRVTELKTVIRPSLRCLDQCGCWLIDKPVMAAFLGVRVPQVQYLHDAGRIPLPIRFTFGPARYAVPELRDWVRMGCPRISEWIELRGISGNTLSFNWGRSLRQLNTEPTRPVGLAVELRQ